MSGAGHPDNLIFSNGANAYLTPYAAMPEQARGRLHDEPEAENRSPFQRDRDRIIHSTAFRRLEYKTQVFVYHEGDHYRTRLTHSLEVAQLARSIARELKLEEDLTEAVALAHDLGHPPFGHAGEDALDEVMQPFGGYDHNAQTIRILTHLEQKYAPFDGLNLTWECLEGIAKHNGPVLGELPRALANYNAQHDLELSGYASLEAQVAALSDDIAYNNHDIEDGVRAGLFGLDAVRELPLMGRFLDEVDTTYGDLEEEQLLHEAKRRAIHTMVVDVVATSRGHLEKQGIETIEDVRHAGMPLVQFSEELQEQLSAIRAFLYEHMYRHYKVNRMTRKASQVVTDLFSLFIESPHCLPSKWQDAYALGLTDDKDRAAEVVADYIAGMTDRYALLEHKRLFDLHQRLIEA